MSQAEDIEQGKDRNLGQISRLLFVLPAKKASKYYQ